MDNQINPKLYSLMDLYKSANEACALAVKRKKKINGAINWADLKCVEARQWSAWPTETGYTVIIQEADPVNLELRAFINQYLERMGYYGIDIEMEW